MDSRRTGAVLRSLVVGALVCLVATGPGVARAQGGITLSEQPGAGLASAEQAGLPEALVPAAADPPLVLTGEPTPEETAVIEDEWRRFTAAFAGYSECMGPIEVRVVARAEDWYTNRNVGPIAAFYRYPPAAILFVEHGKVRPDVLIHEFAHHLDISCGLGAGSVGDEFRGAAGISAGKGWTSGTSWRNVPAEIFAEAVVAFFDAGAVLPIGSEAIEVIDVLSLAPDPTPPAPSLFGAIAADLPLLRIGGSGTVFPGSAPAAD